LGGAEPVKRCGKSALFQLAEASYSEYIEIRCAEVEITKS
jgi:hypothetical protein